MNIIDARWINAGNGLFIDITGISETNPLDRPGLWSCKNQHEYYMADICPLKETTFEGVTALVPFAYDKVLMEEYEAEALTGTEHGRRVLPPAPPITWYPPPSFAPCLAPTYYLDVSC